MNTFWILIMKTLGYMKVALLPLMILGTTMGSSIASQIPPTASPTLEESTSCRRESQEEQREELQASRTGSDTLEALRSLNETLKIWAERISEEKSSQSTELLDESTTKRPDNSSSTTCSPSQ